MKMSSQLWGGRFGSGMNASMKMFNDSINFDKRLHTADIEGSIAYAKALKKVDLLSEQECEAIVGALKIVEDEWVNDCFIIKESDEDIHTANERRIKELIGAEIGGKLHTGRSRNDQVATDMRIWVRQAVECLKKSLLALIRTIVLRSENEVDIIFPGYTHLQRAQPVRWSQWLLSYAWMFVEDFERLHQLCWRLNVCPLGSGAIAGNPFSIDRDFIAEQLSFRTSSTNSMHAVGDRDFVAEFQFWSSLTAVHLSKLAEDLIIYSTKEFAFVTLSDAYSTGSSLMPQKKNADSLELIRGKSARILGNVTGILVLLKATPSTFNKDFQEDKEGTFDTFDNIKSMLDIATGTVGTLAINRKECEKALSSDMLATDIAYYLVRKGMPFRNAHEVAGKVIAAAEQLKCDVADVPLETFRKISEIFTEDIANIWNFENSVEQYTSKGGTSRNSVLKQIKNLKQWIQEKCVP